MYKSLLFTVCLFSGGLFCFASVGKEGMKLSEGLANGDITAEPIHMYNFPTEKTLYRVNEHWLSYERALKAATDGKQVLRCKYVKAVFVDHDVYLEGATQ